MDVGALVGALAEDDLLGDRLLTALEADLRVAGAAVLQNSETGLVSATFCVSAPDAGEAAAITTDAFRSALHIGGAPDAHLKEIQVTEDHEEAATAV